MQPVAHRRFVPPEAWGTGSTVWSRGGPAIVPAHGKGPSVMLGPVSYGWMSQPGRPQSAAFTTASSFERAPSFCSRCRTWLRTVV
jgi:hypothetical protein